MREYIASQTKNIPLQHNYLLKELSQDITMRRCKTKTKRIQNKLNIIGSWDTMMQTQNT